MIKQIANSENISIKGDIVDLAHRIYSDYGLKDFNLNKEIKRGEIALLIDQLLDPFNRKEVDLRGNYK